MSQNTSKDVEMTEITNIKTWQKRLFNGDGTLKPDDNDVYEAFNNFMKKYFLLDSRQKKDLEYFLEHFTLEDLKEIADEDFANFYIIKAYRLLNKDTKEILRLFGGESQVLNNPTIKENEQLRIDLLRMINESIKNNSDGASVNAEQTMGSNKMSGDSYDDSFSISGDSDTSSEHSFIPETRSQGSNKKNEIEVSGSDSSSESSNHSYIEDLEYVSTLDTLASQYSKIKLNEAKENNQTNTLDEFKKFVTYNLEVNAFAKEFLDSYPFKDLSHILGAEEATYFYFIAHLLVMESASPEQLQALQNSLSSQNLSQSQSRVESSLMTFLMGLITALSNQLSSSNSNSNFNSNQFISEYVSTSLGAASIPVFATQSNVSERITTYIDNTFTQQSLRLTEENLQSHSRTNSAVNTPTPSERSGVTQNTDNSNASVHLKQVSDNDTSSVVRSHSSTHHSSSQLTANSNRAAGSNSPFTSNSNNPNEALDVIIGKLQDIVTNSSPSNDIYNLNYTQAGVLKNCLDELMHLLQDHTNELTIEKLTSAKDLLTPLIHFTAQGKKAEKTNETLNQRIAQLETSISNRLQTTSSQNSNAGFDDLNTNTPMNPSQTRASSFSGMNSTRVAVSMEGKSQDDMQLGHPSLNNPNYIPPPPPQTYKNIYNRLDQLIQSFGENSLALSQKQAAQLTNILNNLSNLKSQPSLPESLEAINNISSSLKSLGTVISANKNDATDLNALIQDNLRNLEKFIPPVHNSNSNAYSGSLQSSRLRSNSTSTNSSISFFPEPESTTQEITLYASETPITGAPDLNPVNKTDGKSVQIEIGGSTSVYAPSSGQEYSFSLKEKVSSGGGGAQYNSDDLTSKTYHHASLKISSITNDDQNQKLALTIMNMIENIVSSSQNLKIRTENPLAAAIADVYYNDYLKESGVVCSKYKNPKFTELENNGSIRAKAAGILERLISKQFSSTAEPKQPFINELKTCPWHVAALQVRIDLTNTSSLSSGPR